MTDVFKKAWREVVSPFIARPKRFQVAALCYRMSGDDKEVLLITSRDTGRWILPKGWPIDGLDAAGAAMQEAWEEAGVQKGRVEQKSVGSFDYEKRYDGGATAPCHAKVFKVEVEQMSKEFPECDVRSRKWVKPTRAAGMVQEPGLRDILSAF